MHTLNGRIIFPFYELLNASVLRHNPKHAYIAYSDDHGLSWTTSSYLNLEANYKDAQIKWSYASETQLVEDNYGTIFAFMRTSRSHYLKIAESNDGGFSWTNLNKNINPPISLVPNDYISNTMLPGLVNAYVDGNTFTFYSQAETSARNSGKLFGFVNNHFDRGQLLWDYAKIATDLNIESKKFLDFAYSSLEVLEANKDHIILGTLYEKKNNDWSSMGMIYQLIVIPLVKTTLTKTIFVKNDLDFNKLKVPKN